MFPHVCFTSLSVVILENSFISHSFVQLVIIQAKIVLRKCLYRQLYHHVENHLFLVEDRGRKPTNKSSRLAQHFSPGVKSCVLAVLLKNSYFQFIFSFFLCFFSIAFKHPDKDGMFIGFNRLFVKE